ncbi:MAG: nuclear transport factor 2 family protein [Bacteroidales bacterium]|nr:nuclear transport factor 2 family protein [Bacteroidales bacterium]
MKVIYLLLLSVLMIACHDQAKESSVISPVNADVKQNILEQMEASRQCWNKGDFEGYMQVYWQSDSLQFMGLNSLTKGWQSTLDNYKKGYPTADYRGTLVYRFKHFNQLSDDCVLVIGSFHLERPVGNAEGNFSLIWKRIDGQWRIIVDHT